MKRLIPVIALLVVGDVPAAAHIAPSERDNNRYILVAPLGDGVRLAYTFYMGHEPGRVARGRIDRDRDGRISDAEANAYGRELAALSAPRLSLVVDGRAVPVEWQEIDVGLGDPAASGGAFTVDLVAWICLEQPGQRGEHRLELRDRFHFPNPGETELRVEESPGVRITRSELGRPSAVPSPPRLDYRWMGGPGPAETDGFHLGFEVDPALAMSAGRGCSGAGRASEPGGSLGRGWIAAGTVVLALAGFAVWRRARGRSAGQKPNR